MTKNVWPGETATSKTRAETPMPVGWLDAVGIQRRMLWRGRRRDVITFLVVAVAMLVVTSLNVKVPVIHGHDAPDGSMSVRFEMFSEADFGLVPTPGLLVVILSFAVLIFAALFWALSVWMGEGPSRRSYHWTMPISRASHDLARVAAGGLWLLLGILIMWLAAIVGLAVGGRLDAVGAVSVMGWVNYVVAPVIIYLLVSIAGVSSDRAGRLVAYVFLGTVGSYVLFTLINLEPVARVFHEIIDGTFGYQRALTDAFFNDIVPLSERSNPVPWMWRALLWLGVALGSLITAARRHREP